MFVLGKSKTIFFPSNTLIYGISRDGSRNFNIRTCEHMIPGQLTMGARRTKKASLLTGAFPWTLKIWALHQWLLDIDLNIS